MFCLYNTAISLYTLGEQFDNDVNVEIFSKTVENGLVYVNCWVVCLSVRIHASSSR